MSDAKNICTFKKVCRECVKVEISDRPEMCKAIACEDFDPCPSCGQNRTLHPSLNKGRICKQCYTLSQDRVATVTAQLEREIAGESSSSQRSTNSVDVRGIGRISVPGIPPDDLEPDEKDYYAKRWSEYEGYYRNPSAYYNVHQLILLEIHSGYLNNRLMNSRGELLTDLSRELQVTVNLRKIVSDQLPDKEAMDVMDDEKSMSVIYENYQKEKKLRSLGPVSRVFRSDTLALSPSLIFPIDPKSLLERCGFKEVDIEKVLPRIKEFSADKTPEQVLEFFGFNLNEEYAMNTGAQQELEDSDFDPEKELYGNGDTE